MSRGSRLTAHSAVSTSLALCSDRTLRELVDAAVPIGSGIGGKSALLEVAGTPVFVKRVPLTDPERQPEHVRSTANLFDLPVFCQYGIGTIGGPGFGAWRELAVHAMTTNWVLAAEYEGFPLMYHWRVLPDSTPLPEELADVKRAVAYWGDGSQVRNRILALQQSSASVALFLEYIPQNLHQWLGTQVEAGDRTANRAFAMVERELAAGTSFMNSRGLLHFDAHFENILTDGRRLYFADYGLALSSGFELSQDEADFFDRHQTYDRCYTATYLVNWLVTALYGYQRGDREGRYALVHACAEGKRPTGIPEEAAAIIARHAPIAAVMSDFNRKFQRQSRHTPYPLEEIRRLGGMYSSSIY
ncbi:serine/threonine-protein kinase [Streptomyces platensis]|uniref:serine/threonine-protein kinase n=1 Tax=Streptomyces platensis TaxID=58346 RepID=UPI002E8116F6|nr:serine/threonine-protein kinase [Streptomyces platensis]WTI55335.1 serine/threonine-protein kinase [Streptomyces platensis]WUB79083.1 serine/threonine-protein kinase [Streptomyces platensis]